MASKSANINVNINSNFQQTEKSSEDMRKRIRELRKEFYSLEEGTEEYNKVLAELSKLQLDYSDQTIVMRNSANDLGQRLTNLVKVSGDLMSGFSAVQGVMGLLGIESDGFERTLIRLQSAMAIVQGLEGLEGMIDHMKALRASFSGITKPVASFIAAISNWVKFGKASVDTTRAQAAANTTLATTSNTAAAATTALSTAMRVLRTALISTGIGALVVGVGALISKLVEWRSASKETEDANAQLQATFESLNSSIDQGYEKMEDLVEQLETYGMTAVQIAEKNVKETENEIRAKKEQISAQKEAIKEAKQNLKYLEDYYTSSIEYLSNTSPEQRLVDAIIPPKDVKDAKKRIDELEADLEKLRLEEEELNVKLVNANLELNLALRDSNKELEEEAKKTYENIQKARERLLREINYEGRDTGFLNVIDKYVEGMKNIQRLINAGKISQSTGDSEIIAMYKAMISDVERYNRQLYKEISEGGLTSDEFKNRLQYTIDYFTKAAPELGKHFKSLSANYIAYAESIKTAEEIIEESLRKMSEDTSFDEWMAKTNESFDKWLKIFTEGSGETEEMKYFKEYAQMSADEFNAVLQEELDAELNATIENILDTEDSGLADLTNRRIALLQQYLGLYQEGVASLFSENEYFPDWINNINNAFSALSGTMTDISNQFANFFNEETGEIDFSMMKWQDWTAVATMALNGASDILGAYADSYKDQMEQILESDEATDEQKQEAVKKYKNMMYAQTAIDMLAGMTAAVATAMTIPPPAGPILGAINAATVLASGIASLTQIKAIDPLSENNVSGTSPAGGTPNVSDVAINTDAYANQLTAQSSYDLQGALDERSSTDTRVYVLESDIAETSHDVNTKVSESTF